EGYLHIKDELIEDTKNTERKLLTNFYCPLEVMESKNTLLITDSKSMYVKIESKNGFFHNIPSFYSATYNVFEDNTSYSFYNESKQGSK
ncbi:hypothetical protein SB725_31590, partial [Pseudomonas sp. SIMBA_041]|uniref:hypothetical protein n=1 Tax=Pseudomonas sp. SIMBA_041 TaxID=3085782 RepID=UPI00397A9972